MFLIYPEGKPRILAGRPVLICGEALSHGGTLKVWDARTGEERLTLTGHNSWVEGCAISPDASFIVSASFDNTMKVWDVGSGRCLATFYSEAGLLDCAWSRDGEHIVGAGEAGVYFLRFVR